MTSFAMPQNHNCFGPLGICAWIALESIILRMDVFEPTLRINHIDPELLLGIGSQADTPLSDPSSDVHRRAQHRRRL